MSILLNKNIKSLLLILLMLIVFVSCSNKFEVSNKKIKSDFVGRNITPPGDIEKLNISEDNLKSIKVVDKNIDGKKAKVSVDVSIQYLEKGAGKINKDLKNNDIMHNLSGNLIFNYEEYDKSWKLISISNIEQLKDDKKEVETLIKRIPFNKKENDIMSYLKNNSIGIEIHDGLNSVIISFVKDGYGRGYKTVEKVREFKILSSQLDQNNDLWNKVVIYTDVDYSITDDKLYHENGSYTAKGQFTINYRLEDDNNGSSTWKFDSIDNSSFSIEKK